ncbi:2-oxoacid:acceptor oxidoreductase subunit alpha [Dehalogenimonas alkenigignens]|uniref:2-oxoacid:acceptor oxidoreductase, alpha subunit n=1 Tax=Dehalogenimonas alkenigignens TaxID=1217799 RepID=A0A0W0GJT4_9CHLR|nr:2-oxoacid:acceptor oxidoreductase subunit alpha [Dehalogenimonas alkenigignens]KTB48823.1 2-oxoacid:acceptor oxidoreductase, alpha subunit [Dehalogenimonas alkenigignens]PVV84770.1 2-oxoacid:acceptor oxidoreductase subunit alpha [Dehalogenimonas alkenigignens]
MVDLNIMVGGEAGQGVQSVGSVLAKTLLRGGYEIFADQDFESRIRGGHSFSRVRVSRRPVAAALAPIDILVALNEDTIKLHEKKVPNQGIIVSEISKTGVPENSAQPMLDIPFEKIAVSVSGNILMTNTVAAGGILGLLDYDFGLFETVLRGEYGRKGEKVVQANVDAGRAGYGFAQQHRPKGFKLRLKPSGPSGKMLISGHEALALGVLAAGCKFVAGYPMTPTTSILEFLADRGREFGLHVVQAEDEISAANMAVGAAYAGVRSMTATSGGGFCLMTETLSLAGMTETPLVVVLGQRSGPAIGLPTRTEQGDLLFALHAGHGEFPRAILAPGNAEEAFWAAVKAFNLAEAFQTPVIILTDHDLGNSYYTMKKPDLAKVVIDRGTVLSDAEAAEAVEYRRYAYTRTGISPRAFPGQGRALVVADSDEHNEEGHIIEDGKTRRKMMDKRMRKNGGLSRRIAGPAVIRRQNPVYNLICWGSTYGAVAEAARLLEQRGIKAQVTHLKELWPFPVRAFARTLAGGVKNIVVEANFTGQLENLIRAETGVSADGHVRKYDGRPFTANEIVAALEGGA